MMEIGAAPILLDIRVSNEREAIQTVFQSLREHPAVLDPNAFWQSIWEREQLQAPLLGNLVAMPHARTAAVNKFVLAIGRCQKAVSFGQNQEPVRLIFLYGVPLERILESLGIIAHLAKKLHDPEIRTALLHATTEAEFQSLLI